MESVNEVKIRNVLISCYDKTGLKYFVSELLKVNPDIKIYCSSGTYKEVSKVEGTDGKVVEVSEYTGTKEMPSGLVKTLHPKIHAGILAEVGNEEQKKYVEDNDAVEFDLIIVNLYPFSEASQGNSVEKARTNVDIGGVSLIEASAKNFLRVSVIVSPVDYEKFLEVIKKSGCDIGLRLELAKTAMDYLSGYLNSISDYYAKIDVDKVKKEYGIE
jgi:phosphoribosylaminoimidazolecarboxamide formyltransferase / IMP cyclohydrolase